MVLKTVAFISMVLFAMCLNAQVSVTVDTILMGSAFNFTGVHQSESTAREGIDLAIEEVVRIERLISSWDNNSETTAVNRKAGIEPVIVSLELIELIERAKKISRLSNGYFDISYASLDKIWYFDEPFVQVPDETKIKASVEKIDYENIIIDKELQTVFLREKGMKIGFGAIGKGYAANRAKMIMTKNGLESGVVNAGGDLIAWGMKPGDETWKIGITDPLNKNQVIEWLSVNNTAVVTSGNYERYIEINDERYCHIINPKTGWPCKGMSSVTIICQDAELADGLATTVFVLGLKDGMKLINHLQGVEGILFNYGGEPFYSEGLIPGVTGENKHEEN